LHKTRRTKRKYKILFDLDFDVVENGRVYFVQRSEPKFYPYFSSVLNPNYAVRIFSISVNLSHA
ncbi:MAG TPA: hypothetical protein PK595_09050, partial [Bacteroidota bacterium]|nr:hypothetical protein [Bacteroidota bacterium]